MDKIEDLIIRVAALEALFTSRPGDVREQRRRSELIRYATIPLADPALSFSQGSQGHRASVAATAWKAGATTTCRPHSRRRRYVQASRIFAGDYLRLPGLLVPPKPFSILTRTTDVAAGDTL